MNDVLVTGLGVMAPTGIGADTHWKSVLDGASGIGTITRFDPSPYPVRLAGQVPGFDAGELVPARLVTQTDHFTHLALAAARAACDDAGIRLADLPEYDVAVVTASSSGGTEFGQHEMERLYLKGPDWVGAYQSIAWFYAASTGQISIRHGTRGPAGVLCTEQAGGLDVLGHARRLIASGTRVVLAGGTDASLCPYGLVAQLSTGLLSTDPDPARAYRPFAADACGYVPGEGGAMLVLESGPVAAARGRTGYARLLGYATGFDPPPGSPRPRALRRVVGRALADAGLRPSDVDVVFADALGVPGGDADEAATLAAVFGPGAVPVTAPKTLTGRLYAGGGALDVATAALALRDGLVPPTAAGGNAHGDETDLVVGTPRALPLRVALVLARGHGGFTSAVVLGHPEGTP